MWLPLGLTVWSESPTPYINSEASRYFPNRLLDLDFNRPLPQPKSLAEAQSMIDVLWQALGEAVARIEKLEEQRNTDSHNSSQPPSNTDFHEADNRHN
jgi:hypothetical protein